MLRSVLSVLRRLAFRGKLKNPSVVNLKRPHVSIFLAQFNAKNTASPEAALDAIPAGKLGIFASLEARHAARNSQMLAKDRERIA